MRISNMIFLALSLTAGLCLWLSYDDLALFLLLITFGMHVERLCAT